VLGRVGADLYPLQLNTPLEAIRTFERFVGGFAGNVATGLARLGVRVAILSAVGDDGHGRFIRTFLAAEGVDVTWLRVHPTLRTALAFCEAWPPDRFPITFYRTPTCPDWELRPEDLPLRAVAAAPLLYVSGTGLAREPSRGTTFAALAGRARPAAGTLLPATVLDLDWRQQLWDDPAAYAAEIRRAAAAATVVLGGTSEFAAARLEPEEALSLGPRLVVLKRGPDGAVVVDRAGRVAVPGLPVPVVNGLGAGDAFAAAFGAALLAGLAPREAVARANAAGAIVAARLSCSTAMPRPWEIDALLAGGRVVDGEVLPRPRG
jgi:5-dehydro-2-deoxygluconokinase